VRAFTAVLLLAASSLPVLARADAFPSRVEITYAVSAASMKIGEGRDVFEQNGRTYSITSESRTTGVAAIYRFSLLKQARGQVTASGLRPDSYEETRNGRPKRSVHFDWDRKLATLVDSDSSQTVPLPDNTWDMTSFGYSFAFSGLPSSELSLHLTDGRHISAYRYAVVGHEKLETALGTLDTLHLKKLQAPGDPRAFDVWLAVERRHMPVRIRATEKDGTVFDSVVTQITVSDK
jgi:hypothetical protein